MADLTREARDAHILKAVPHLLRVPLGGFLHHGSSRTRPIRLDAKSNSVRVPTGFRCSPRAHQAVRLKQSGAFSSGLMKENKKLDGA